MSVSNVTGRGAFADLCPALPAVDQGLRSDLQQALDQKTKPVGALGDLETLATQLGCIQMSLAPEIRDPHLIVFAGDHGIAQAGVSQYPSEVTAQMVLNFLSGGAAINVLTRHLGWNLLVVDAGVAVDLPEHKHLIAAKVARGTRDFRTQCAMDADQLRRAWLLGQERVATLPDANLLAFGEMGIGNTSAAAMLMHAATGLPLDRCVGRGTGIDESRFLHKRQQLEVAAAHHGVMKDPFAILQAYAGFEMVAMAGAMMQAARDGKAIVVDGFIATSVVAVLHLCDANFLERCIFAHQSAEQGHGDLLCWLNVKPMLQFNMRLGEGSGAALALPILQSATAILREMASFDEAGVSQSNA